MKILIAESDGFSPRAIRKLSEVSEVILEDLDRPALLEAVAEVDALWVRLRNQVDAEVMAAAPRLRAIATATTGLDHVDLETAFSRGIEVVSLRGETAFLEDILATAEHTLLLMLSWLRHLPAASAHVHEGGWNRDPFRGGELRGRTVGVVGYGRLGRQVARLVRAFGAEVLTTDPYVHPRDVADDVQWVPLPELLSKSDIVTIHVHLGPKTDGLIGVQELAALRPGALLVNTSRGGLLDEEAVLASLDANHLGGLAADVLRGETSSGMGHHALVERSRTDHRVLLTPHIGGATWESMQMTEDFLVDRVLDTLRS